MRFFGLIEDDRLRAVGILGVTSRPRCAEDRHERRPGRQRHEISRSPGTAGKRSFAQLSLGVKSKWSTDRFVGRPLRR